MKKLLPYLSALVLLCSSCNGISRIFDKKTPHEAYADKIGDSPEGQQWVAASEKVLTVPQAIVLPYKQTGYFPIDKPRALALQFNAKQGERINFALIKKTGTPFVLYADLFKQDGAETSHILAVDTNSSQFGFNVEETGIYILRLQPELNRTAEYDLSATIAPSLYFPVAGNKARARSFWGDVRDGGQRSHEGIDIFAPKLTPAIAAADGYITGVNEGGIGGKTIWLKAKGRKIHLYYAHLDTQLVREGQDIKSGDTLGLIGNTGNAKYTPPHLHFGVYTNSGPIDPLPFVNRDLKPVPYFAPGNLTGYLQLKPVEKSETAITTSDSTLLVPLAINADGYIAEFPDGNIKQAPLKSVKQVKAEKKSVLATDKKLPGASPG